MKIAIVGYGVEGRANYRYYSKDPSHQITIFDHNFELIIPEGIQAVLGPDAFEKLADYDLVLRSPAIPPSNLQTSGKVWSGTNEFFAKCPADIIGVTGSKGKGTTSSLIASMLEAAERKVWLVGNIGMPALDILDQVQPHDIVVYELSSFQLWDIEKSPKTAVVLFIEPDHLNVHKDMAEYIAAKANITKFQAVGDLLIFNAQNKFSSAIGASSVARKLGFATQSTTHIKDDTFYYGEQKMCSVHVLQIIGDHNITNAIAAIDAVWQYTQDLVAIEQGLHTFRGLPHRLAFVRRVGDIDYYDDSIATTAGSTVAALQSFSQRVVLILGGSDKGSDYGPLLKQIILSGGLRAIVTIGTNGAQIVGLLDDHSVALQHHVDGKDMKEIVAVAASIAQPGDVVLLSPAAASFDMFKSYADRGDQFVSAVNNL